MGLPRAELPKETKAGAFKRQVFFALENPREGRLAAKVFSIIIFLLIIVNVVLVFAETKTDSVGDVRTALTIFDVFSLVFFSIEYLLRIWTADLLHPNLTPARARLRYMISIMGLVDLLAVLPSYLPFMFTLDARIVKSIRLVRLVRLFKITRYMDGIASIGRVFKERAHQIISALFVVMLLILVAAVLMYQVEHGAQPDKFDSVFTGLYWAMVTITSTGYGDITPITPLGRALGFVIMGLAIGVVAIPAGILSAGFVEESRMSYRTRREDDAASPTEPTEKRIYCPYCGHRFEGIEEEDVCYCAYCGHELR